MFLIGRYSTFKCLFENVTITLHVKGGSPEMISQLYELAHKAIKLKLAGQYKYKGEIDTIYVSGGKITLTLIIEVNKEAGQIFSLMNKDVRVEIEMDLLEQKKKTVARRFLPMVQGFIKKVSKETGYTEVETQKILENAYSEEAEIAFNMYQNKSDHELEAFYSYMRIWAQENQMSSVPSKAPDTGIVDQHVAISRRNKKCCICDAPMHEIVDVFPLCYKHEKEIKKLQKTHNRHWKSIFRKKYKFD